MVYSRLSTRSTPATQLDGVDPTSEYRFGRLMFVASTNGIAPPAFDFPLTGLMSTICAYSENPGISRSTSKRCLFTNAISRLDLAQLVTVVLYRPARRRQMKRRHPCCYFIQILS